MSKTPKIQLDANVIAVVHRAGRSWRCVIAQASASEGGRLKLIDHAEYPLEQESRLLTMLDRHRTGWAIVVLPSASVICRTCPLPNAPAAQLETALRLQAESHLLGQVPPHRQAIAVLPTASGETNRSGIMLAWPETAPAPAPDLAGDSGRMVTYAPDIAAMAALLNGTRTAEPLIWLDRTDGSLAIAMPHAGGATFRATRENLSDESWIPSVCRAVAETALSVNHSGPFVDALIHRLRGQLASVSENGSALIIPSDLLAALPPRIEGTPGSSSFWPTYGVAMGALLATTDQLAALTQLLITPPVLTPSPLTRAVENLSSPRMTARVVVVCLLLIALMPLVFAALRLGILTWKLPNLAEHNAKAAAFEHQLVMYRDMRDRAWPMTKLLADIASNTPEGVEVQILNVTYDQEIRISGKARKKGSRSAFDNVALMEKQLSKSTIFDDIRKSIGDGDSTGSYEFDLFTRVKQPHAAYPYPDDLDFAQRSLEARMYPGASTSERSPAPRVVPTDSTPSSSNPAPVAELPSEAQTPEANQPVQVADKPDDAEPIRDEPLGGRKTRLGPDAGSVTTRGEGEAHAIPPSRDIPEPVSDEQIAAMSHDEAHAHWGKVAQAIRVGSIDKPTEERLRKEFRLLGNRVRETKPKS